MIDPHIHVLPAVDDGARSRDISRQLIQRMASSGYSTLIATPHVTDIPKPAYAQLVKTAFEDILPIAREYGIELLPGYEVLLTPHTADHLRSGVPLTLGGSKTVLVEVTMAGWPAFTDQILHEIQIAGFTPILAHPERYQYEEDLKKYLEWKEKGVLFQLNLLSLLGYYGRGVQQLASRFLDNGLYAFCGSDLHHVRHAEQLRRLAADHPEIMARLAAYGQWRNATLLS